MFVKDTSTGEWTGYEWEFGVNIADTLGAKPVPVETQWANIALDLQAGRIDAAIGASPTPARAIIADYALSPLFQNYWAVIAKKNADMAATWKGLNTPSARVGVEIGSGQDPFLTRVAPGASVTRFRNQEEGALALMAGRIDMYVDSLTTSLTTVGRRPELGKIMVPKPEAKAPTMIAIRREVDKGWLMFMTIVSLYFHENGTNNETIMRWMAKFNAPLGDIPEGVTF
jgi:ABC-type amino acid transport substrate-binding protein